MSSEELNKTSKKIPSKDLVYESGGEDGWDIEELKRAIIESAEHNWDKYAGG